MKKHFTFFRVVFAILVFSLVIPVSPSVSIAKAKICCKKNCRSMEAAPRAASAIPEKHCGHQTGSAPCGNDSCLITDEKAESFSFAVTQTTPQLNFSLVASLEKESPQLVQFVPVQDTGNKHPSLYLANSILRI